MADALDYRKDGKEGAARRKYKMEVVAERMADYAVDHFVTWAMQRGLDHEADARMAYEVHTGNIVTPARFVLHPTIAHFGGTPDSFMVFDPGLLELKVPLLTTYLEWRAAGVIPEEHLPQILAQLACTRRKWTDFCAYSPELKPPSNLFIRRFEPNAEDIAHIEAAAKQFLFEVDALFDAVTTAEAA